MPLGIKKPSPITPNLLEKLCSSPLKVFVNFLALIYATARSELCPFDFLIADIRQEY